MNGFPIKEAKEKLRDIQRIPDTHYEAYVQKQRAYIINHHLENNPFYAQFIAGRSTNDWAHIPVMSKAHLQRSLEERLSNGHTVKKVYVNKTSGSSGHPFVFAKDKMCHALTWAEILNRFEWYGLDFHSSYQARFYGIPLDRFGYGKERFKDLLSSRFRFPIFDLSEDKMESFLSHFRRKKFDYINGYTSSIVLFAKYILQKKIVLKEICPTLNYCVVTSEMLYASDKKLLEEAFGIPVINEYGASELDLIAFTNPQDEFVINSETLFVEILDHDDNLVPHGQPGRIVITGLYNEAHPMIRYDIGDTGILSPESTFKKPILQQLIGRTNDVAKLPSGKTVPGLTFYYVTKSVIEDDGTVSEFVIEQHALDHFKILYTSKRDLNENEIHSVEKALEKYLEKGLRLELERVALLDRGNRGKLKQFISLLPAT